VKLAPIRVRAFSPGRAFIPAALSLPLTLAALGGAANGTTADWAPITPPPIATMCNMTLAVDGSGNVYAAGCNGDDTAGLVSKLVNGAWVPMNPPGYGSINNIGIDPRNGDVYVVGPNSRFTSGAVNHFSGGQWGTTTDVGNDGDSVAVGPDGTVAVGGGSIGNGVATVVFLSGGTEVGISPPSVISPQRLLYDASGNLYAAGYGTSYSTGGVAVFSGASWSDLTPPGFGFVDDIAFGPGGALYASGRDPAGQTGLVAVRQGSTWVEMAPPGFGEVMALAFDALGRLYVGGTDASGATGVVSWWDGTGWTSIDPAGFSWVQDLVYDGAGGLVAFGGGPAPGYATLTARLDLSQGAGAAVPEPATGILLAIGCAVAGSRRRRLLTAG
jgi:hypothetical protein